MLLIDHTILSSDFAHTEQKKNEILVYTAVCTRTCSTGTLTISAMFANFDVNKNLVYTISNVELYKFYTLYILSMKHRFGL